MSSTNKHNQKPSVVGSILRVLIQLISWVIINWLIAQLILIIEFAWLRHSLVFSTNTALFTQEIASFSRHATNFSVKGFFIYQALVIIHYLQAVADHIRSASVLNFETKCHTLQTSIQILYTSLTDYLRAVIVTTQIVLLRITNIFLFTPLILLLGFVGSSNGLVARYLRRINGGHESSLIYHYAKLSIKLFIFWGSLLYVVLPFPLTPTYFLLPCAIASSLAVYLTVKTFKKYS